MNTRSGRILAMLNLPKYETTKGLDDFTRIRAIKLYDDFEKEQKSLIDITKSKQNIIEIEPGSTTDQNKENTNGNERNSDSENIIENSILTDKNTFQNVTKEEFVEYEKENEFVNSDTTPDLSFNEDVTSGSEYLPSDDGSIVPDTTDEEIPFVSSSKITEMPMIKVNKRRAIKVLKTRNRTDVRNIDFELPSSTTEDIASTYCKKRKESEAEVVIFGATKANGKRVRNKGHSCYFCQKVIQNCARHFEVMHAQEADVAKILCMPKKSNQRKNAFINLIRVGDFYHNSDVLSTKRGELILVRRPTEEEHKFVKLNDYGPCPQCLGFMLKKHLWNHMKTNCTGKKMESNIHNRHVIAESNAILNDAFGGEFSSEFVRNISSKLRDDTIGDYCRNDNLILNFGAMQFEKYGTTQCELIRQSMRQLARFTLKLREIENTKNNLSHFLQPQKFDLIVQATKLLCISHQNSVRRPEFEIPSLALKIGYALKKCAAIKRGSCLRALNAAGNEALINFLHLMELEWNSRISSNALATMYNRRINATQLLPLTSDLIKLSQHIDREMKKYQESVSKCPSIQNWAALAGLTLSKIILFNKRRSGEASRMTLKDYSSRPTWNDQCTEELKDSLSDFEKKLANQLTVVEIIGKRGRKVPVLLTEQTKGAIDILVELRNKVGISIVNPFMFARGANSCTNMRGHDCLRKTCAEAFLQHSENITSTKLRKYIATVCQVFNLNENEYDWLARHLGHDIRVHREFYRLHESAVELTKVSRLLIAVDRGDAHKFKGKKLEEINLEDLPTMEEESGDENENCTERSDDERETGEVGDERETEEVFQDNENKSPPPSIQGSARKVQSSRNFRRRPWSAEEKEAVLKFFSSAIKRGSLPGKADCLKCIEKYHFLSLRTWSDIKFCIKNHLSKINKMKKH